MTVDALTYRSDGQGDPLLLLNGGLMTIASWDPIAVPLATRRRVLRCDLRGQLLSPGSAPHSLEDHARDVVDLLDRLSVPSVDLLGTSFGALVAMVVAARAPERVRRLVIVTATAALDDAMRAEAAALERYARAAAAGGDGAALFRAVAAHTFSAPFLARQPADWIETRARLFATMPRAWFEGIARLMEALGDLDLHDALGRIAAPTLVIGAELDAVFPVKNSHALARAIEGAELAILDGVGHGAVVEAPERLVERLETFLGRRTEAQPAAAGGGV